MGIHSQLVSILAASLVLACTGCGGGGFEAEVSGTVSLDGAPVGPGVITFSPQGTQTNPATGAVQPDGSYFLKTSREVGLAPGQYQVSVTVFDQPTVPPGQRSTELPKLVTPEKYADPRTSGLEFSVEPGENEIDVELSSK